MKKFKDIRKKSPSMLGWGSSHAEQRKKKHLPMLSWDSSFAERRNKKKALKEAAPVVSNKKTAIGKHEMMGIEEHPDAALPHTLSKEHEKAIVKYTSESSSGNEGHASSGNMNAYLRNRAGDKTQKIIGKGTHPKVKEAVHRLSSAFTPENTNKKPIVTFSGVPKHIGEHFLKAEKGSQHALAGFTSTSTDHGHAIEFAHSYNYGLSKTIHMIRFYVHKGAGLSTSYVKPENPKFSPHEHELNSFGEKEVILNHGAHVTYHGTEKTKLEGSNVFVHHLEVHPHRTELHEYPSEYEHPAKK